MSYYAGKCDIAVIGAGHAGIEAALAAARLGLHTILFTINLDAVANLPSAGSLDSTFSSTTAYRVKLQGYWLGLPEMVVFL